MRNLVGGGGGNFVPKTCRMDSRRFEFMRHVAVTKVCPRDLSPGVFSTGEMSPGNKFEDLASYGWFEFELANFVYI